VRRAKSQFDDDPDDECHDGVEQPRLALAQVIEKRRSRYTARRIR
jgi:hypothetical protein